MFSLLLLAFAIAFVYLTIGFTVMQRAMRYVHERAMTDQQFFTMAVLDGRSISMLLPKLFLLTFWLPVLIAVVLFLAARAVTEHEHNPIAV